MLLKERLENMFKAVFFDIDGTLFSHKSMESPASTKKALEELRNKGVKTFIATGRHFVEMQALPIKWDDYDGIVVLNGQICLDKYGKTLY